MAQRVYADPFTTSNYTSHGIVQPTKFNKNIVLRTVRAWVVIVDDPTFTNIRCKIFSDDNGNKGSLLETSSNSPTKSEIITLNSGIKEIGFSFNDIVLHGDDTFYFGLGGDGASFTDAKFIAMRRQWPDPYYTTGLDVTFVSQAKSPFSFYFEGADV